MPEARLLLVPSFTELEWGIRRQLEEWAEVATFDAPGVGETPLPPGLHLDVIPRGEGLTKWREAAADQGLREVDRRRWDRFVVVTDAHGTPSAVRIAGRRRESVDGLAIGHAALSSAREGERAPVRSEIWDVLRQLAQQGSEAFVRYGIAQATRGGVDEATAQEMVERFPDMSTVASMVEILGAEPEPIGDDLAALGLPLLLARHEGCLGRTEAGFEDITAAFPDAETVVCPEACSSSPAFAEALRRFCMRLAAAGRRERK